MSRLASLLIVLLAIAVATPVLAEDRLSLSGAMRVRGFHVDIDGQDQTNTWADQRLRIGGKLSVAEGVSATFRFDATEANWGSQPGYGAGRLVNTDTSMQWDRAHLDVEKGAMHLRAGLQFVGFGKTGFDAQDNGLSLNVKGAVPVTLFYMLDDDNNTYKDPNTVTNRPVTNSSDAHYYGLNVGHSTDMYAANVFAAGQKNVDEEVYVLGLTYAQNLDALNLYTELEYFTGDANATDDAYGLQAMVDVSTAVAENVTIGGQFYYAMGDDKDTQYAVIGNGFNGWDPIFQLGTSSNLILSVMSGGRAYEVLGSGAGLYAGRFYADMKATDEIMVSASAFYGVADEDDVALYEDALAVAAGMKYNFMPKTFINFQVQYTDKSKELATTDLERLDVGTALVVNF